MRIESRDDGMPIGMTTVDYEPRRDYLKPWAEVHYIQAFNMKGKILDAGCGDGFWASIFMENGLDVVAFDPTIETVKRGHERYPNLDLRLESIESAYEKGYSGFDTVFVRGVSPFHRDIDYAATLLKMLLTMGERVLLIVCTYQTNKPNQWDLWSWDEATYRKIIAKAGGKIKSFTKINTYLQFEVICDSAITRLE